MRPEVTEGEEEEEDIQSRLDSLLGRDSDSDQEYVPSDHLEESEDNAVNLDTSERDPVSSDDSDIEAFRDRMKKFQMKKLIKTKTKRSPEVKVNYVKELNSIPSKMKNIADSSNFDENGGRYRRSRHVLVEEIIEMIPQEDPEDCCRILIEMMSLPLNFWTNGLKSVKSLGHEGLGLAVLDVVHRCISNKTLFLQTILSIGKVSLEWREAKKKPMTFLRCCSVLISAGDLIGLTDLFQDYEPVKNEVEECGVMRCVVSLMKVHSAETRENLSVGGSSSVHTGADGLLSADIIIETLTYAVRKQAADVEWFLPLLCDYMMGRLEDLGFLVSRVI